MFGIDLIDAAFLPAAMVALLAGVLSFLSPCVLPVVPPYLAYMTGITVGGLKSGERSAVPAALMFVLGRRRCFWSWASRPRPSGGCFWNTRSG